MYFTLTSHNALVNSLCGSYQMLQATCQYRGLVSNAQLHLFASLAVQPKSASGLLAAHGRDTRILLAVFLSFSPSSLRCFVSTMQPILEVTSNGVLTTFPTCCQDEHDW